MSIGLNGLSLEFAGCQLVRYYISDFYIIWNLRPLIFFINIVVFILNLDILSFNIKIIVYAIVRSLTFLIEYNQFRCV